MTNLTIPNKIIAAAVTDKAHPTRAAASTPDGMSFGDLLAQQVVDIVPALPEINLPTAVKGKDALASSKPQDGKKPVTQPMPADLPANVIALLQPLQDIHSPVKKEIAHDSEITKTDLPSTPMRGTSAKAFANTATKGIPGGAESNAIALAPDNGENNAIARSNTPGDAKNLAADSINLTERPAKSAGDSVPAPLAQNFPVIPAPNLPPPAPHLAAGLLPADPGHAPPPPVLTPLGNNGWADEFSQSISWMTTRQQDQIAELHLNPPDLGPLNVTLKLSDNQATAIFTSPHSAVREAVENSLPKLREILADNGIALGNTTVSDQPQRDGNANAFSDQQPRQQNGHWAAQPQAHAAPTTLPAGPGNTLQKHNGMVDTFA